MRFGWLAAAAAMVLSAGQADAATIVKNFNSSYARAGSTGPFYFEGLNLSNTNFIFESGVINYTLGLNHQRFIEGTTPSSPGTLNYSGNVGFEILGLTNAPRVFLSVPFSGSVPCEGASCRFSFLTSGVYNIPEDALEYFATARLPGITATGEITANATVAGQGARPSSGQPETGFFARGNITFETAINPVPEPASWAMMIAGFGMVGGAMRRRKGKVTTRVAFA